VKRVEAWSTCLSRTRSVHGGHAFQTVLRIYIRAGEHDRALEAIEYLLSRLPPLDVGVLRLDPIHDSLRDDPRFIALLNESG
jgi:hypothetical protein